MFLKPHDKQKTPQVHKDTKAAPFGFPDCIVHHKHTDPHTVARNLRILFHMKIILHEFHEFHFTVTLLIFHMGPTCFNRFEIKQTSLNCVLIGRVVLLAGPISPCFSLNQMQYKSQGPNSKKMFHRNYDDGH